jgi:hypothetical protein
MLLNEASVLSTLSTDWIGDVSGSGRFDHEGWSGSIEVAVTTLQELTSTYGTPAFCKIDVEGHELQVLRGMGDGLPALSFEFVPERKNVLEACLDLLADKGEYRYNLTRGPQPRLLSERWLLAEELLRQIDVDDYWSGDIYAVRQEP